MWGVTIPRQEPITGLLTQSFIQGQTIVSVARACNQTSRFGVFNPFNFPRWKDERHTFHPNGSRPPPWPIFLFEPLHTVKSKMALNMNDEAIGEKDPSPIFPLIKLNIGGQYSTTSRQTLERDPDSELAAIFSKFIRCEDGAFFIDWDGTHFRSILDHLRTGRKLILPEGATALSKLLEEAEFYQIEGISKEVNMMFKTKRVRLKRRRSLLRHHSSDADERTRLNAGSHVFKEFLHETWWRRCLLYRPRWDSLSSHTQLSSRAKKFSMPEGETAFKEQQNEAEFYQIKGIMDALEFNSEITTEDEHRNLLLRWLPPRYTAEATAPSFAVPCFSRWIFSENVSLQVRQ